MAQDHTAARPARKDRTLGPREILTAVVHSRWATFLVNPLVAAVIFFGGMSFGSMRLMSGRVFCHCLTRSFL